jgi:hypothetical protein
VRSRERTAAPSLCQDRSSKSQQGCQKHLTREGTRIGVFEAFAPRSITIAAFSPGKQFSTLQGNFSNLVAKRTLFEASPTRRTTGLRRPTLPFWQEPTGMRLAAGSLDSPAAVNGWGGSRRRASLIPALSTCPLIPARSKKPLPCELCDSADEKPPALRELGGNTRFDST